MNELAKLAGFIAAHAIWCVADEGPLVPMIGLQRPDGSRGLLRFADADLATGVSRARAWLDANPENVTMAVAALDGFYPLASGKSDAIILEGRLYSGMPKRFEMAVPYRPKAATVPFTVYRPKFVCVQSPSPDFAKLAEHFFVGVDSHKEGVKVWDAHLDQGQ